MTTTAQRLMGPGRGAAVKVLEEEMGRLDRERTRVRAKIAEAGEREKVLRRAVDGKQAEAEQARERAATIRQDVARLKDIIEAGKRRLDEAEADLNREAKRAGVEPEGVMDEFHRLNALIDALAPALEALGRFNAATEAWFEVEDGQVRECDRMAEQLRECGGEADRLEAKIVEDIAAMEAEVSRLGIESMQARDRELSQGIARLREQRTNAARRGL